MSRRLTRWTVYVLIAIGFAIACVFLSNWQFERNETRAAQIELVEQNYDAAPVPLSAVIGEDGALDPDDEWRPVTLQGEYLADQELLVRNRPHGGTSAFEVLVPFRDADGRIFIVDRGWVPPGEGAEPDSVPSPPDGEVEVTVRLRPGEQLPASGRGAPEGQVPTINLPSIAEQVDGEVITGAYGRVISEEPAGSGSLGGFDSPTDDPGPHLSYAIQWILFALMGFIFIGYIIRTEIVKHREEVEGVPAPVKSPRRRDHDADVEDELLDVR
ncbi:SURF1 family protein [Microbacterium sp. KKR3/1]|uniref:SURF1 family cytochrome oxidase biogenesis protein n=1 Tax=unclassified Microbacterium TaxID=2609290 RepID=UPI001E54D887|nr:MULTISPECIES: SURF1 family protein [unclassified Microbacterium]MCE0507679.1 SURF1 family protein [Microbacterium sp. KKR3/1]UUE19072.1 SURF1 family protein [Microbacterium sp. J1-1]